MPKPKPQVVKREEPLEKTMTRMLCADAKVEPKVGYYYVYLPDEQTYHIVTKDKRCYTHGENCVAVQAVGLYLQHGGEKAPDCAELIPPSCPVCGGVVHHEPRLTSWVRGLGWVCETSAAEERLVDNGMPEEYRIFGQQHYWKAQAIHKGE